MRYLLLPLLLLLIGCQATSILPPATPDIPYNANEADKGAFFGTITMLKNGHPFPYKPFLNTCTVMFAPPYEPNKEGAWSKGMINMKESLGDDKAHVPYMAKKMASNPNTVVADLTDNGFVLKKTTLRNVSIFVNCMERNTVAGFKSSRSEKPVANQMATNLTFNTTAGSATYFGDIIINFYFDSGKVAQTGISTRASRLGLTLEDHEKEAVDEYKKTPQMPNSYSMRKSLVKLERPQ